MALLEIRNLHLTMTSFDGAAHVLNGINLTVERGEVLGLVGETGCGKSLTGLSISRLVPTPPGRYTKGQILLDGQNLLDATEEDMRRLRGRRIGMIFQDPTTNLNPAFRVSEQMVDVALHAGSIDSEILGVPASAGRSERRAAARKLTIAYLDQVGIPDAAARIDQYPHQFSGGMRQRVLIAMALIGKPDLLVADEPTTALDVSVQAQILRILARQVALRKLGLIMITHNLGVVAQICSHVAVMYAGNIVETGPVEQVLRAPRHPYTQALLAAMPRRTTKRGDLQGLAGQVPNLIDPPKGCRFASRCALVENHCHEAFPASVDLGGGHTVACIHAGAEAAPC